MMRMLLLPAALAACAMFAPPLAAQEGAARVQRYLDEITTLSAHFEQTLLDPDGTVVQVSEGSLQIARPGRFRWDYAPPHEQLVVADGQRLWLYDPSLEQVTVKALDETLGSTPAMLLSGAGKVADAYNVTREYDADGLSWVELEPRAPEGDFRRVRLAFAGSELRRMELMDALDQVTRIELSQLERNPELPGERFAFVPPPGTDVVGDAPPASDAP